MRLQDSVRLNYQFIPEDQRILHYAACDVAVFPSLYEPFGIVALEAMSMSEAVVGGARDISGMREQVVPSGPEQCGFHINPHDPSDIAWGVISAVSNRDLNQTFGRNARMRAEHFFTWERPPTRR
jgi:glycosyltransferase involved in cell wall biosynthesis